MAKKSISEINIQLEALKKRDVKKIRSKKRKLITDLAYIGGGALAAQRAFGTAPEISIPILATALGSAEAYEHREWIKKKLHGVI